MGLDGRSFVGIKDLSADKREKRPKMTVQGQQSITMIQRTHHARVLLNCTETTGLQGRRGAGNGSLGRPLQKQSLILAYTGKDA